MKHADLRMMLLFGDGTLCVMDGIDAAVRSGGNFLMFFMRLNLIAWFRFVTLVLKEICIRAGIALPLQKQLDAFKRINEALNIYLRELEKIDTELFKQETAKYSKMLEAFENAATSEELNIILIDLYKDNGLKKPWQGDFNEHMSNKNNTLVFE